MFKSTLEAKLKKVFGINQIIFDAFQLGKEQEALFVDIDNAKDYTTEGNIDMLVLGRLSISGPTGKFKYGWVRKKFETANKTDTADLFLGRDELPIKFMQNNNEFIKYEVEFVYRFKESFNPKSDKIGSAEIKLQEE